MSVQLSVDGNDVTSLVRVRSGLAFSRGKDQLRKYAPASAGQLNTALDNVDGSLNPGSMPFGPGDEVQATLTSTGGGDVGLEDETEILLEDDTEMLLESGMVKTLWTGHLVKTRQQPDNNNRSLAMLALGDFSLLRGKRISTPVFQNISTGAALNIILDMAGWPADKRQIATGLTILPWWWLNRENAFDAAERLRLTEGPEAVWVEDRDGNAVFQDRAHRATQARSLTPQIVFTDSDIVNIDYDENEDSTIEQCIMRVDEMAAQALAPVWEGEDFTLGPSEEKTIRFQTSEPFINALLPDSLPSNTIWKFVGSHTITSGTYKIEYLGQRTAAISWNASGAAIATELQSLSTIGSGNASGSGSSLNSGVFIELIGAFAGVDVPDLPTIVESTLNPVPVPADINVSEIQAGDGNQLYERQRFTATGQLISGQWSSTITFATGTHTTALLNYNASATEIRDAFRGIFGLDLTTANNGPVNSTPVDVNFVQITDNIDNVIINNFSLMRAMPSATVNVTQSQQGGVADYVVASGVVAQIHLAPTSGFTALVTFVAGVTGASVVAPRVRAQSITVVRSHEVRYPDDDTIPDGKIISPNVFSTLSLADAEAQCESYVNYYLTPRPTVRFTKIVDKDSSSVEALAQLEISDRATIDSARLDVSGDYFLDHVHIFTDDTIFAITPGFERV